VKSQAVIEFPNKSQGSIIRQQPQLMLQEQAKADAIIQYAVKVKDWPKMLAAIEEKIEQQQDFVDEWKVRVSPGKGGDRRSRKIKVTDPLLWSATEAERQTGIGKMQVTRFRQGLKDRARYRERQIISAFREANLEPAENHRAEGTGENEWFTPEQYIEAARDVLGAIDLDPASHPKAQEWIKADRYFTRAEDGLAQEWHGRVWLNPPYARLEIVPFIDKLLGEIELGHVSAAILLTHNYTDTDWFHRAMTVSQKICFTRGRVRFVDDIGDPCAPTQGQAFFYYGPEALHFTDVFDSFGKVVTP
jgi:hypothetical protein